MPDLNLLKQILEATRNEWDRPSTRPAVRKGFATVLDCRPIYGNVFKLSSAGQITNLYSFTGSNGDGAWPNSNLTLDAQGNLYGATSYGGSPDCYLGCGVIFKVSPDGAESILFTFTGGDTGFEPSALIRHSGYLYGTTTGGGTSNVEPYSR